MKSIVEVFYQKQNYQNFLSLKKIKHVVEKTFLFLGINSKDYFFLNIIDELTMQKINEEYYPFKKVSNVLTFPLRENNFNNYNKNLLGEIYLCWPVVWKESLCSTQDFIKNSFYLILHGLLHLLGFDHIKTKDKWLMEEIQDNIFEEIKF